MTAREERFLAELKAVLADCPALQALLQIPLDMLAVATMRELARMKAPNELMRDQIQIALGTIAGRQRGVPVTVVRP